MAEKQDGNMGPQTRAEVRENTLRLKVRRLEGNLDYVQKQLDSADKFIEEQHREIVALRIIVVLMPAVSVLAYNWLF